MSVIEQIFMKLAVVTQQFVGRNVLNFMEMRSSVRFLFKSYIRAKLTPTQDALSYFAKCA